MPTGATSSNIITLSSVSPFRSLRVDERPGAIFHAGPFPGITTKPFASIAASLCCLLGLPHKIDAALRFLIVGWRHSTR